MAGSPSAAVFRRPLSITPASVIVVCVAALVSLGLVVLFSASSPLKGGPYAFLWKQLIFLAGAIGAGWLVAIADLEQLRRFAWVVAGISLALLVLVLLGRPINGSRRWLNIAGLGILSPDQQFVDRGEVGVGIAQILAPQAGRLELGIENAQGIARFKQLAGQVDIGAFAQVVGVGLECQPGHQHPAATRHNVKLSPRSGSGRPVASPSE